MTPPASSTACRLVLETAWHAAGALALVGAPAVAAWDVAAGRGLHPLAMRLGAAPRSPDGGAWFTAASAGEVAAALPLLRALAEARLAPLVLSVLTPHGLAASQRHASLLAAPPFHPPVDVAPCISRALARLHPRAVVSVETEIWPNLFRACRSRAIPVAIVNARLSERALPRYRRVRPLIAAALGGVELVASRTQEDAERLLELGASPKAVHVVGNLKFDAAAGLAREPDLGWARAAGLGDGPWLVLGSTAEGEEEILLAAFREALARRPDLRCLLAPKRPERWDEVARLIEAQGLPLLRRSSFVDGKPPAPLAKGGVLLLDSIGELGRAYRHGTVAFVGGSLVPHGGQNLLEPAASGVPVLFGPSVANFRDAEAALLAAGGGKCVAAPQVAGEIGRLVTDERERTLMAGAARSAIREHEGATSRTMELLRPLLRKKDGRA